MVYEQCISYRYFLPTNFDVILFTYTTPAISPLVFFLSFQDVQLISLCTFSSHMKIKLGGLVLARSVKFLGKLEASLADQETREGWWEELRDEIRSHAKVLCCRHVIGYKESCAIYGSVCVLSAFGTAAVLKGAVYPTKMLTLTAGERISNVEGSSLRKGSLTSMGGGLPSSFRQSDFGGGGLGRGGS